MKKIPFEEDNGELVFRQHGKKPPAFTKQVSVNLYIFIEKQWKSKKVLKVPSKHYDTNTALVKELNMIGNGITFSSVDNKMKVSGLNANLRIVLHNGMHHILGLKKEILQQGYDTGEQIIELNRGIFAFFIYTNIVGESIVGDKLAPLLRSIHIEQEKHGQTIHQIVDSPLYMKLNRRKINEIEIYIVTDYGTPVPFTNGKCFLLIDFKPML